MSEEDVGELYELSWIEVLIWCILYGIIAFFGVAGNLLVIVVTVTRLRTRSITTYFIINLAIADLLTAIFAIPFKFQAALFQVWHLPSSLCQIVPYTETVTLSVSVFTLTASAIHEFRTVFFPKRVGLKSQWTKVLVVSIWIVALLVSLPHGLFHQVYTFRGGNETIDQCRPVYAEEDWWKIYNIYLFIIHYFVPMIILDTAYTMIACRIYTTTSSEEEERQTLNGPKPQNGVSNRQLMKMLMIVVLVFTLCWAPLESYLALNEVLPQINDWKYINVFFFCSHWLAMSNSCLNPIIYGVFNAKYQREFIRIFRCLRHGGWEEENTMKFDTELESNGVDIRKLNNSRNGSLVVSKPPLPSSKSWLTADCSDESNVPFYSETYQSINPIRLPQSHSYHNQLQ